MVPYEFLADVVMVFHALLIFCAFAGVFLVLEWRKLEYYEAIGFSLAVLTWTLYEKCPFTVLESYLRTLAGAPRALDVGFITYYSQAWFGFTITENSVRIVSLILAIVFITLSIESLHTPLQKYWKKCTKLFRR